MRPISDGPVATAEQTQSGWVSRYRPSLMVFRRGDQRESKPVRSNRQVAGDVRHCDIEIGRHRGWVHPPSLGLEIRWKPLAWVEDRDPCDVAAFHDQFDQRIGSVKLTCGWVIPPIGKRDLNGAISEGHFP